MDAPTPGSLADDCVDADPEQVARQILLRRLEAAPRTRAELAGDLRKRGVPDDVAESVLDRFTDVGLIDDDAFAEAWVASRLRSKGLAPRALSQELRRKGVSPDVVSAAIDTLDDDQIEAAARRLVQRKVRSATVDRDVLARRLFSMLARKGYSSDLSLRVIREEMALEFDQS